MDDEKIVRSVVERMLKHLGYEVAMATSGTEAIDLYIQARESGNPFTAAIMDLTIPGGMGGGEAIKRLQEIDPDIKAIVSSGYSNDPTMADFASFGFRGVLAKPFRLQELAQVLQAVVEG
jgi:CheY-like chemotaxis protein